MKDFRQSLLATFHVEHDEHVQRIRETLTAAEGSESGSAGPDLDEAFRRAHSLKGAARAVDLRPIENLAHRLETLFARIRTGAVQLNTPVIKVIHQVLDSSEDSLASMTAAGQPAEPVQALAAIDKLLGTPDAAPVPAATPAPAAPVPGPTRAALDTVRLNAESLDRIVSSSGQLMTENLRQNQVTRKLRDIRRHLSDTAAERERVRKSAAREFRQLEGSPALATAARYLNYLDHQVHVLSQQVGSAVRAHERNAWTLRGLSGELQRDVRQARMVPAGNVFDGFRKMVRDVAKDEGKSAELHVSGAQVEADRVVLQALKDPVMHMLRNAVSHGLEPGAERVALGKRAEGRIDLVIEARGNQLHVSVEDDGRGVDGTKVAEIAVRKGLIAAADVASLSAADVMRLVLLPGFSTSKFVTELSGRGMGLSVVAEATARLQGKVDISAGKSGGTRVSLSAPLSVSSQRLLLVACQGQTMAVPLHGVERLRRVALADLRTIESIPVIDIDGQPLPVVSLAHLINTGQPRVTAHENALCVMVMRSGGRRLAVAVDAFLSERESIVKELPVPANGNSKIAGGVLLEDGTVCLVLNPVELIDGFQQSSSALTLTPDPEASVERKTSGNILVVDDSLTTRTLEKSVLEAHGYQVAIAVDGVEALKHLRAEPVGLVISDLEMPRLDGFGLLEEMKRDPRLANIPVVIVSSIENAADQARGMALGADAYIVKRRFEQQALLETIRQIL